MMSAVVDGSCSLPIMTVGIGDKFPNVVGGPTQSTDDFDLYKYLGDSWGLLLFYPHTGHAVGATDLSAALCRSRQFEERGVRLCGVTVVASKKQPNSNDSAAIQLAHQQYCREVQEWCGAAAPRNSAMFPCVLLSPDQAQQMGIPMSSSSTPQSSAEPMALVGSITYVLKPDRTVATVLQYPSTSGRHYDEIIRLLDSLQLHVNMNVMTPADWQSGESVLVDSKLTDEQAKDLFGPDGVTLNYQAANSDEDDMGTTTTRMMTDAGSRPELPYLRWTKDPTWFAPDV